MNTPAHLLIGMAAFGRRAKPGTTRWALAGAIAPDVSLYLMAGWALFVAGYSPNIVFGEMYYGQAWQRFFAIDNSILLWGIALTFAIWAKAPRTIAFLGAGLLHLFLDFPLHNHDARMHFWPATDWVFVSPLSYWDRQYHAHFIAPIELALSAVAVVFLWKRLRGIIARALLITIAAAELAAGGVFQLVF